MKNKLFLIRTFLIVSILFSLQAAFNYFFDSYGFFLNNNNLNFGAKALAEGNTIAVSGNYDERIFQQKIFEQFTQKPQCILIGSSRSMMVASHMVNHNGRFFNHSVSGASIEDYISIIGLYMKNNTLPKTVILGIDPWVFNKNNSQKRWRSLNDSYSFMINKLNKSPMQSESAKNQTIYAQLINYENTKNNLLHFKQTLKNETNFKIINNDTMDTMIKKPDGTILYPFKTRYKKDSETLIEANTYIAGPVYSIENFTALSNTKLLEKLIHYLQSNGTKVIFFLPPYHPVVYQYLSTNQKYLYVLQAENYLNKYAQKNNLTLLGSYNPNVYRFRSSDFTDGMHPKASVAEHIFKHTP